MSIDPLLALIRRHESGDDYNRIWAGIARRDYPPALLTTMTIKEVLDWQDSIDRLYMSEAAGAYQVLEDTLRGLVHKNKVTLNDIYSPATQDKIAIHLMNRRGLKSYQMGLTSVEAFGNSLAKEWASLPVMTGPNMGRSYYAGDGLNAAHASVEEVRQAIEAIAPGDEVEPEPELPNWLRRLFHGKT